MARLHGAAIVTQFELKPWTLTTSCSSVEALSARDEARTTGCYVLTAPEKSHGGSDGDRKLDVCARFDAVTWKPIPVIAAPRARALL